VIAFRRYGIPYNAGSLPKQFGTVVRKIIRLAVPPKDRGIESKRADERIAA
jgi:NADPH-dependent stearoyl-CoA 9-desaturase